jgi:hypothetical protein
LCRTEIGPKDTSMPVLSSFAAGSNVATTLLPLDSRLSNGKAMCDLVTEEELARARSDPAFRQQFLAQNLDRLLEALRKMRRTGEQNVDTGRQLREGADLAVKLADRLQNDDPGPRAA